MSEIKTQEKIFLLGISALSYMLIDLPVRLTTVDLPPYIGIKNFLPFMLGIFFGFYGVLGACLGSLVIALSMGTGLYNAGYECYCIIITGLGIWYGWHIFSKSHHVFLKEFKNYARYILLVLILSALTFDFDAGISYFLCGILIGIPVTILFGSILCVIQIVPSGYVLTDDANFYIDNDPQSISAANEVLEEAALTRGITINRVFELQSCIEEIALRILNVDPNLKIHASVVFTDAISARLDYPGKKYNPLKIAKDEDEIDVMGLKIFRHRALRAMFNYWDSVNKVHIVV